MLQLSTKGVWCVQIQEINCAMNACKLYNQQHHTHAKVWNYKHKTKQAHKDSNLLPGKKTEEHKSTLSYTTIAHTFQNLLRLFSLHKSYRLFIHLFLASFPSLLCASGEKKPNAHCLHMLTSPWISGIWKFP